MASSMDLTSASVRFLGREGNFGDWDKISMHRLEGTIDNLVHVNSILIDYNQAG